MPTRRTSLLFPFILRKLFVIQMLMAWRQSVRAGGGAWFSGDVKLCVVGIAVKMDSKVAEDVTKGEDVYDEKKRSEH